MSRYITHVKRLKNSEEAVQTFFSRANCLKNKLGPVLFQLPGGMERDDARLESFLSNLKTELKTVFEFRHQSWWNEEVFKILRRFHAGFCIFDMPGAGCPVTATADFAYVRFHGSSTHSSNYSDQELMEWAAKLWALGPI